MNDIILYMIHNLVDDCLYACSKQQQKRELNMLKQDNRGFVVFYCNVFMYLICFILDYVVQIWFNVPPGGFYICEGYRATYVYFFTKSLTSLLREISENYGVCVWIVGNRLFKLMKI